MILVVEPDALVDIEEARRWYREIDPRLSVRFEEAISDALERIVVFPESHPEVYRQARRVRLCAFPYGVYYVIRPELREIVIVACIHSRRASSRWKGRV